MLAQRIGLVLLVFAFLFTVVGLARAFFTEYSIYSLYQFELWTNILYVWPVIRAVLCNEWFGAAVFYVTFFASSVHHGCINHTLQNELIGQTHLLLIVGTLLVFVVLILHQRHSKYWNIFHVLLGIGLIIGSILLSQADACLYHHHDTLPRIWSTIDFVAANSSLFVIALLLLRIPHPVSDAIFWLFAITLLILDSYTEAHLSPGSLLSWYVFAAIAILVVLWIGYIGLEWNKVQLAAYLASYDWLDFVAGIVLGIVAVSMFVFFNEKRGVHGWWHVVSAFALYVDIEAVCKSFSLWDLRPLSLPASI